MPRPRSDILTYGSAKEQDVVNRYNPRPQSTPATTKNADTVNALTQATDALAAQGDSYAKQQLTPPPATDDTERVGALINASRAASAAQRPFVTPPQTGGMIVPPATTVPGVPTTAGGVTYGQGGTQLPFLGNTQIGQLTPDQITQLVSMYSSDPASAEREAARLLETIGLQQGYLFDTSAKAGYYNGHYIPEGGSAYDPNLVYQYGYYGSPFGRQYIGSPYSYSSVSPEGVAAPTFG